MKDGVSSRCMLACRSVAPGLQTSDTHGLRRAGDKKIGQSSVQSLLSQVSTASTHQLQGQDAEFDQQGCQRIPRHSVCDCVWHLRCSPCGAVLIALFLVPRQSYIMPSVQQLWGMISNPCVHLGDFASRMSRAYYTPVPVRIQEYGLTTQRDSTPPWSCNPLS